jgi:DeoR C terminal sensor domain
VLFLGVHGMDPIAGFTTPNISEAETNRTAIGHARRIVVLADHTKWRTIGLHILGPLSAAGTIITNQNIAAEAASSSAARSMTCGWRASGPEGYRKPARPRRRRGPPSAITRPRQRWLSSGDVTPTHASPASRCIQNNC